MIRRRSQFVDISTDAFNPCSSDVCNKVLTDVDRFTINGKPVAIPVMGTASRRHGKISAWRDYFDMQQFASKQMALSADAVGYWFQWSRRLAPVRAALAARLFTRTAASPPGRSERPPPPFRLKGSLARETPRDRRRSCRAGGRRARRR
jgi:hypothetical protein